jgi:hypothetical protein
VRLVSRTEIGLDPVVRNSNGTPRPVLVGERWITHHWPGVDVRYATVDVTKFVRNLEAVMAARGKPNEYNYVIGPQDDGLVHEYAGGYAGAHSAGENLDSVGCLFLVGIGESITDAQIVKYQWLRDRVLKPYGIVRSWPEETPHGDMPGANSQCPGPTVRAAGPRLRLAYIEPLPPEADVKPIVTTWEGEPWPILVGFDPVLNQYTWRGFPGPDVDRLIFVGACDDGRATPWPVAWKTEPWVRRVG